MKSLASPCLSNRQVNVCAILIVIRLMKQPYITYATAATMWQLELEFKVNFFYTPAKFLI